MNGDSSVSKVNRRDVAKEALLIVLRRLWSVLVFALMVGVLLAIAVALAAGVVWLSETHQPVETVLVPWGLALIEAVPDFVWTVLLWILNLIGLWILLSVIYEVGSGLWKKAKRNVQGENNGE